MSINHHNAMLMAVNKQHELAEALRVIGVSLRFGRMRLESFGVAFDVYPVVAGVVELMDDALINKIGEEAEEIGLEWGGRMVIKKRYTLIFRP